MIVLILQNLDASNIENITSWKVYYRCQCAMAGVALVAALVIKPLPLIRPRRSDGCEVFLRMRTTRLCRGGMLILLLFVYFLYYLGEK